MNIPDKEILSRILSDNSADLKKSAEELELMLDKELSKSEGEIDFGLIEQLSIAVSEASECDNYDIDVNQKLTEFEMKKCRKKSHFRISKRVIGLIAACFVLIIGNVLTINALDMDLFSFVVAYTKGGAIIDFGDKSDKVVLPVSPDDPYGIIGKCEEEEIETETPHYIPDGFTLKEVNTECIDNYKCLGFYFKKGKESISFTYDSCSDSTSVGIPSDKHNISEISINGHVAVVSKEDNQMLVVYRTGDYWVTVFTENVDYSECEKILESIK